MKKLALIIVLTIIGLTSFAQLTLLHTFDGDANGQVYNTFTYAGSGSLVDQNKYYYSSIDGNVYRLYLYNANFGLDNIFSVQANNLPQEYSLQFCQFLSNNLINTDDYDEWLIVGYNRSASDPNESYYSYIVNSQGDIIHNFGYSFSLTQLSFHIANGQIRTTVPKWIYDVDNSTHYAEIYSCGGSVTRIVESKGENSTNAYPNPATSFINLPYELNNGETSTINIYDINGRLIEQKPIGYHFKNLELNVSNYKTGTYIYEYNGKSNRLVVQ